MKNKKGFTLIELLAVIVILAVIALIATPIILNMIENARKGSAKVGTTHYIDTLEKELMYEEFKEDMNPEGMYLIKKDGSYEVNGEVKKLSIKGSLPTTGTMCVNEDGIVESYSVVLDGYVITKTAKEQQIEKGQNQKSITCNVAEEIVEIKIPENSNICSQTKEIVILYPEYEGTVKEYSLDNKEWKEYKEKVKIETNGILYARLRKGSKTSSIATMTFTTLDNEKVTSTSPTLVLSEEKPTSEINVTFNQTDNCGLQEEKNKYGISETKEGTYTWQEEALFSGLKNNTTYYIKTRANDIAKNGIVESEISEITTGNFKGISITPSSTDWTTSKTVTILGSTTGAELQYKIVTCTDKETCTIKTDWTKYSSEITIDWIATTEKPTYVYARFSDGTNYSDEETLTITTVDTTAPLLTLGPATTTTKSIVVPINTNSDDESGIKSTTCKLGTTSGEYTIDGTISNNACTSPNLTNNTTYYYKVTTTNNVGKSTTKTGSAKTGDFAGITITPSSTNWTTSKTVTITGTTSGAELQYKIVTCTDKETCATKTDWTKYSSEITINWTATTEKPTYVYARFSDGTNYSNEETITITTVDTAKPTASVSGIATSWATSDTVTLTLKDSQSGIVGYTVTTSTSTPSSYTSVTATTSTTASYKATANGTYYVHVKDASGRTNYASFTISKVDTAKPTASVSGIATSWATSDTVTLTLKDSQSGVVGYAVTTSTSTPSSYTSVTATTSTTASYKATANGTYYVHVKDASGRTNYASFTISKVDTAKPTASVSGIATSWATSDTVTLTLKDSQSGIVGYTVTTSTSTPSSYTSVTATTSTTASYKATSNGTYYVHVKDASGRTNYASFTISKVDTTKPTVNSNPVVFENAFIGSISYSESRVYDNVYLGSGTATTQLQPLRVKPNTCSDNASLSSCTISCSSTSNLVGINNTSSLATIKNKLNQDVALVTCKVTATDTAGNSASRETNFYTGSGWYKKPNTANTWKFVQNNRFLEGFHQLTWYKAGYGTTLQEYYFATYGEYEQGYVSEPYIMYIGPRYVQNGRTCYYFTDTNFSSGHPQFPLGAKIYQASEYNQYHFNPSDGRCEDCQIKQENGKNICCMQNGNCQFASFDYLNNLLR